MQTLKLTQLTFSRFIAAIAIVIFHFREQIFPFKIESIYNFAGYFNVFVSYFFVLSGFILAINYTKKISFKQFYINRFARIYPLYLFALLLTILLIFSARTPKDTISFNKVFLSMFLIQSWFTKYALVYNFPSWSLSVEAFFYLSFPFAIYFLRNERLRRQLFYIALFWVIMQVLFIVMILNKEYFVLYNPLFHFSTFLIGIASGKLFISRHDELIRNISKLEFLSAISTAVIIYLIISKNFFFNQFYQNGFLAPVFILFIYTIALSKKRLFNAFNNRHLQYLGEISYGIYILQIPVSILVSGIISRSIQTPPTLSFYIYLIVLISVSALTHEVIEKPARTMIRNRVKRMRKLE